MDQPGAHRSGGVMIQPTWFPEPLTPAELAAAVVASDLAGQVEAATWGPSWVTADDARVMRQDDRRAWRS